MAYDNLEYIKTYKKTGVYPRIHNNIFSQTEYVPVKNVLDLGCSIGILTHRLGNVYDNVVGIEPNRKSLENAIFKDNVTFYNFEVNKDKLKLLKKVIEKHNIEAVFARRVISEIYTTGGEELLYELSDLFKECEIKYLVIEGRIDTKRATHYLNNVDKEIRYFINNYKLINTYNNCRVLELIE